MKYFLAVWIFYDVYLILSFIKIDDIERSGLESINSLKLKETFIERLYYKINYGISFSNRKDKRNPYCFLWINFVVALCFSYLTFYVSSLLVPSMVMLIIVFMIPLIVLDIISELNKKRVAIQMGPFISALTRWSVINDDIYFCMEKSLDKMKNPLKAYVRHFLVQVKYSGNIAFAFDQLLLCSENDTFRNFVINLKQSNYNKGNLFLLLERLEEESYQIEGEIERRHSETYFDRLILFSTMIFIVFFSFSVLTFNPHLKAFYFASDFGRYLLTVYLILFLLGIVFMLKVNVFNH